MPKNTPSASRSDALAQLQRTLGDALFFAESEVEAEIRKAHGKDCNDRATVATIGTDHACKDEKQNQQQAQAQKEQQALATLFPHGLPTDELIELLYSGSGCGALALCFARSVSRDGRAIAVIDTEYEFYPHTALTLGVDLAQLIIFRPQKGVDEMWVLDQTIRCRGFAAVLWRERRWKSSSGASRSLKESSGIIHMRHLRRIQLACQEYNTLGLLLRPRSNPQQWTAAKNRLLVDPVTPVSHATSAAQLHNTHPISDSRQDYNRYSGQHVVQKSGNRSSFLLQQLRIQRLRGAHLTMGNNVVWEIDHENGTFCQATPLPVAS